MAIILSVVYTYLDFSKVLIADVHALRDVGKDLPTFVVHRELGLRRAK